MPQGRRPQRPPRCRARRQQARPRSPTSATPRRGHVAPRRMAAASKACRCSNAPASGRWNVSSKSATSTTSCGPASGGRADRRTVTPGATAMWHTAPWPANQVSVQPPRSAMRTGAVTATSRVTIASCANHAQPESRPTPCHQPNDQPEQPDQPLVIHFPSWATSYPRLCETTSGCWASCWARRSGATRGRRSSTWSSACARWPRKHAAAATPISPR